MMQIIQIVVRQGAAIRFFLFIFEPLKKIRYKQVNYQGFKRK